ncbi:hypothetical protein B0H14DRAFT_3862243 [Mycena olivaceomarginata]|nr:hypothetical protein B0H14DRAFT_3862243 [Mycena olivaceomarginata]
MSTSVSRVPRREKGHLYHPAPTSRTSTRARASRIYSTRSTPVGRRYTAALRRPHPRTGKRKEGVISARPLESTNTGPSRPPACVHTHCQAPCASTPHAPPLLAVSPPCRRTRTHHTARHDGARAAAKSDPTLLFIAPSPTHRAPRRWERTGNPIHGSQVAAPNASRPRPRPHRSPFPTSHAPSSPRMRCTPRLFPHCTSQLLAHTTFPSIARASFLPHRQCAAHVPSFVLRPACSSSPRGRDPRPRRRRAQHHPVASPPIAGATPSPPLLHKSRGKNGTSQKGNLRPLAISGRARTWSLSSAVSPSPPPMSPRMRAGGRGHNLPAPTFGVVPENVFNMLGI